MYKKFQCLSDDLILGGFVRLRTKMWFKRHPSYDPGVFMKSIFDAKTREEWKIANILATFHFEYYKWHLEQMSQRNDIDALHLTVNLWSAENC